MFSSDYLRLAFAASRGRKGDFLVAPRKATMLEHVRKVFLGYLLVQVILGGRTFQNFWLRSKFVSKSFYVAFIMASTQPSVDNIDALGL